MSRLAPQDIDPITGVSFRIGPQDRVATAGSCFAQHIARTLRAKGFRYLVTEEGPADRGYGVYPARFGNIYTPRQLLQLFDRAYGLFAPVDEAWTLPSGALVDPFRPNVEPEGFADLNALAADRRQHLSAVRAMFEHCDVMVFTLGLTEAWRSTIDGAVFPLAPGVTGSPSSADGYEFHNFNVAEMLADMRAFIAKLQTVNPGVRIIITVSPVALMATYERRHVLVSTVYSKAALRVVAEELCHDQDGIDYFPSFEIINGPHHRQRYFADDLREVLPEGVDHVMSIFSHHYLNFDQPQQSQAAKPPEPIAREDNAERDALYDVICDEEALDI